MKIIQKLISSYKTNYYIKIVTLSSSITIISLIIFLLFFSFQQNKNNEAKQMTYDQNTFNQMIQNIDGRVFENIYNLAVNKVLSVIPYDILSSDISTNPFINNQTAFENLIPYKNELAKLHQNDRYIKSIDVYSYQYDTYISSTGSAFYNVSKRHSELKDIIPFHIINNSNNTGSNFFWMTPTDNAAFKPYSSVASFVNNYPMFSTQQTHELQVIINVFPAYIYQDYVEMTNSTDSYFFALDDRETIILDTAQMQGVKTFNETDQVFNYIKESNAGYRKITYHNSPYNLIWQQSANNNFKYVYISPRPNWIIELLKSLQFILVIFVLITVLCLCFSIISGKRLYQPIKKMLSFSADIINRNQNEANDIEIINSTFTLLKGKLFQYESLIEQNAALILNNIGHELIRGNISGIEDLNNQLSIMNASCTQNSFLFFIVKMDHKVFMDLPSNEQDIIQLSVQEIVKNSYPNPIPENIKLITHYSFNDSTCFIVNIDFNEYENEFSHVESILKHINRQLLGNFNIAISPAITCLANFSDEYTTVMSYFKYGFIYGNNNIFYQKLIADYDNDATLFNSTFLENFKILLDDNKFDLLKRELSSFYEQITLRDDQYSSIQDISLQINEIIAERFETNKMELPKFEEKFFTDVDACIRWYTTVIDLYADAINDKTVNLDSEYMKDILEFIEKNISIATLSVVSEKFKISSGHLSRIFKKSVGEHFSDYIVHRKLEYSRNLLQTTNMKISDISNEIGYFNVNYFNKIFKSKYNITPSQYRKSAIKTE